MAGNPEFFIFLQHFPTTFHFKNSCRCYHCQNYQTIFLMCICDIRLDSSGWLNFLKFTNETEGKRLKVPNALTKICINRNQLYRCNCTISREQLMYDECIVNYLLNACFLGPDKQLSLSLRAKKHSNNTLKHNLVSYHHLYSWKARWIRCYFIIA